MVPVTSISKLALIVINYRTAQHKEEMSGCGFRRAREAFLAGAFRAKQPDSSPVWPKGRSTGSRGLPQPTGSGPSVCRKLRSFDLVPRALTSLLRDRGYPAPPREHGEGRGCAGPRPSGPAPSRRCRRLPPVAGAVRACASPHPGAAMMVGVLRGAEPRARGGDGGHGAGAGTAPAWH